MASAITSLTMIGSILLVGAIHGALVLPTHPPMGVNSFDLQYDRKQNPSVPVWNETTYRRVATAMASQLLPHGYDTMVIDGGWSANFVDGNGRPIPDPLQWPSSSNGAGFKPLADWTHSLGLKFGIWTLRGVNPIAAERKLPVLGADPPVTIDRIIYDDSRCFADPATARWCNCTWDSQGVGIDAAHPAAQSYYNSVVDQYAAWGVDFIKWDCMYDDGMAVASYSREEVLAANAVRRTRRPIVLSLSPGGGMTTDAAAWVAGVKGGHAPSPASGGTFRQQASMYRVTGDFHSRPLQWIDGLGEHAFVVGNLTERGLIGVNSTWPDLDIMDLGRYSGYFGTGAAQLHAVMWMMARSPLMYGGAMPIEDPVTLRLVTNKLALMVNRYSDKLNVTYSGDCRCHLSRIHGNACRPLNDPMSKQDPCVVTWWSNLNACRAVAVMNIGNVSGANVDVSFKQIGLPPASSDKPYTVARVYEERSEDALSTVAASVQAMSGTLLLISPHGTDPADCAN